MGARDNKAIDPNRVCAGSEFYVYSPRLGHRNRYPAWSHLIENPYQSPSTTTSEPESVATESTSTFAHDIMLGVRVAIKWVTIIIAPILVLAFIGMLGLFAYRGTVEGNWSQYFDSDGIRGLGLLAVILCAAYVVSCFWGSLFAAVVYSLRYLISRGSRTDGNTKNAG